MTLHDFHSEISEALRAGNNEALHAALTRFAVEADTEALSGLNAALGDWLYGRD